ncbi:hypothetical protein PPERSA_07852 [Pseudocohnilembus persalinus]|uniref:RRM domain-containing protein n=1 Tax=Pseudocohnilembus persalinus TaxID=266149 RepID=A0A0V0QCB8_PSEPJ|nr:hypothetical protein PPERSA_07852 [Pseudocohnilembus persalinus]|eukprot:KRW99775.1 hypothetical protein PPERSA_07852 [Pseudocohnilembus persalinus]
MNINNQDNQQQRPPQMMNPPSIQGMPPMQAPPQGFKPMPGFIPPPNFNMSHMPQMPHMPFNKPMIPPMFPNQQFPNNFQQPPNPYSQQLQQPQQQLPQQTIQQPPAQPPKSSSNDKWKKLWIGGLPSELPDEDIQTLLSKCGDVVSWKRTKNGQGQNNNFGFVEFSQVESVLKCMRILTDYEPFKGNEMKIKPSEQTSIFLSQWQDLKSKEWSMKSQADKMGFPTFSDYLKKDDENIKKEIAEFQETLDVKLQAIKKELEREEEKKEHPREKERDYKKRKYKQELETRGENALDQLLHYEKEKKKLRKKEKEKEKEKIIQNKKKLQKDLEMDSDEERKYIMQKYNYPQRKKVRLREEEKDEDDRKEEEEENRPKRKHIQQPSGPIHQEEMEQEYVNSSRNIRQPENIQKTFQMKEIVLNNNPVDVPINAERQQRMQMTKQEVKQEHVQGFGGDDDEEEEDVTKRQKIHLNLKIPGAISQTQKLESLQQKKQEEQKQEEQKQPQENPLLEIYKNIPKTKEDLFSYKINWPLLAKSDIIEKKIRPYLIQKSKEQLGDEEPNFVKMIVKKLNNFEPAEKIIQKVEVILEEDAEDFVIKLWRNLIFETLKVEKGIIS